MDLSVRRRSFGTDDQSWLGSAHGTTMGRPVTLDVGTFDAGTHYPQGALKSGLPLTVLREENGQDILGLWTVGTDVAGHLLTPVEVSSGATYVGGALYEHGRVITSRLPVAPDAAGQATAAQIIYVS